jgi:hypothetical protein
LPNVRAGRLKSLAGYFLYVLPVTGYYVTGDVHLSGRPENEFLKERLVDGLGLTAQEPPEAVFDFGPDPFLRIESAAVWWCVQ